ncbi:MAG: glycosyltransferase family 4 protein [Candidatus Thermoplasmatota archaeon]|nr:glycosyltransferase family 4 protein [Candidatus Thermoplasmatota archaeon]
MKIVHFSWEFPPTIWGGLGTFATELSKKQVSLGNNVTVFALNSGNNFSSTEKWNGVEVHRPKTLDLSSSYKLFANRDVQSWGSHFKFFADVINYNISSASHLINTLTRTNERSFDIIDGHDWLGIIGGMIAKKELKIPLVFHIHSTEGGRSLGGGSQTIKHIEFEGGQAADCIITVSHAMKNELQDLGFPTKKIHVCWNGVDPEKYNMNHINPQNILALRKKYGIPSDQLMLLFVGRLVKVKGADNLVQAMPNVLQEFPNTKLILLGVGDMEITIQRMINELGLQEKVILRNEFVPEEERILHYAASDIVVLPSLYEPFGIVCTEAMSMGKPVVVGARGTNGMREQVVPSGDDQCGRHVNPFEPSDIAWGIKQVLESKEQRILMGNNARKQVIQKFSWDLITQKTLEIYKELMT